MLVLYLSCELPSWLQLEHRGVSGLLTFESTSLRVPVRANHFYNTMNAIEG